MHHRRSQLSPACKRCQLPWASKAGFLPISAGKASHQINGTLKEYRGWKSFYRILKFRYFTSKKKTPCNCHTNLFFTFMISQMYTVWILKYLNRFTGLIVFLIPYILANNPRIFGKIPSDKEEGSAYSSVTYCVRMGLFSSIYGIVNVPRCRHRGITRPFQWL